MYVCICHAITDGDIGEAESQGARSEFDVFSHYGVKPQCGRCVPSVRCLMKCTKNCPRNASQATSAAASAVPEPGDASAEV